MKPRVILDGVIDFQNNGASGDSTGGGGVWLWLWEGVGGEWYVVGAVYIYNEWGVVVLEESEDVIVGCGECVG